MLVDIYNAGEQSRFLRCTEGSLTLLLQDCSCRGRSCTLLGGNGRRRNLLDEASSRPVPPTVQEHSALQHCGYRDEAVQLMRSAESQRVHQIPHRLQLEPTKYLP